MELDQHVVPIEAMISEVEYELRMRSEEYPRKVRRHAMRPGEADEHTKRMRAVLFTLKELQEQRWRRARGRDNA